MPQAGLPGLRLLQSQVNYNSDLYSPLYEIGHAIKLQFAVTTAASLCAHGAAVGPDKVEWCRDNTCYGKTVLMVLMWAMTA